MANKIQVKRGVEANIPILDVGEPAFTTDTKKLFIGTDTGNMELATKEQINNLDVEVKSQLAQKANQEDVRKRTDVDPITLSELHTEVKTAMTGGSVAVVGVDAVGVENIKKKSVNESKATFFKTSKNLFDKYARLIDTYVSPSTGATMFYDFYDATDFISCISGEPYVANQHMKNVAYYDSQKVFISSVVDVNKRIVFSPPPNAVYFRASLFKSTIDALQIEKGTVPTLYMPFYVFDPSHVDEKSIEGIKIKDRTISESNTTFFETSTKNLLNPTKTTRYTYVSPTTGGIFYNEKNYSDFRATDFIPVIPETSYVINKKVHSVAFYNSNKEFISGYWTDGYLPHIIFEGKPFTTPLNATFMRVNLKSSYSPKEVQIEQGTSVSLFEPYHVLPPNYIPPKSIDVDRLKDNVLSDFATKTDLNRFAVETKSVGQQVSIPNGFNKWKILDDSTKASKWTYDAENSTALGTVTEVTEVDMTNVPSNFPIPEYMRKPWLFSEEGMLKGAGDLYGNKMLKFEVSSQGNAFFHMPLPEREDFSEKGEFVVAIWKDGISNDADPDSNIVQVAYHDYPNNLKNYHQANDTTKGMVNGKGNWLLVSIPSIRKQLQPQLWNQQGSSPYGISTLSTVDGFGLRIFNTKSDGKKARFYVSGVFRIDNTLDKGKLIIDFDDGFLSQYQEGFRYMYDTYGYKGNMGIVGSWVEQGFHGQFPEYPTVSKEQILEMQKAGWDITSHTWSHKNLGYDGYDPSIIVDEIQKNYHWLDSVGVDKGKRFLIYPEGSWNRWTKPLARQFHVMGRGSGIYMQISPTVTQFKYPGLDFGGRSENEWRYTLQTLQDHKGVAVRLFHHIGTGAYNPIEPAKFRAFIDMIQEYDVDVITWSDFYDNYVLTDSL